MTKIDKIINILPLLSEKQLDILDSIISSWNINSTTIHTDDAIVKAIYESTINPIEDPLKTYSKEEVLDEYGVLFYNQSEENIKNNTSDEIQVEYPQAMDENIIEDNKYNNLDIKSLISNKPTSNEVSTNQNNNDDFDPLFPDVDFDSMTGLNKSKYDDLDFSALISKKPK